MDILVLPAISANEDSATLLWEVADRSPVRKGQVVVSAETSKTIVELSSEANGYLYQLVANGDRVAISQAIALVYETADLTDSEVQALVDRSSKRATSTEERKWTKRAELVAAAKGIRVQEVPGSSGTVTESDVLAYVVKQQETREANVPASSRSLDLVDDVYKTNRQQRIILIGDGLAAVQALSVVNRLPHLRAVGILDDDSSKLGNSVMGVPVIDRIDAASKLWDESAFDVALCLMPNARAYRREIFEKLRELGIPFANVIDPSVCLEANVELGQGNLILANCRLAPCSSLGDNNILSAYVNLDHHSRIGSHCTFGPAVFTSGEVVIGDDVKFGTGVFIEPLVTIGDNCVVASGVVLVGPVAENSVVKARLNYTVGPLGS